MNFVLEKLFGSRVGLRASFRFQGLNNVVVFLCSCLFYSFARLEINEATRMVLQHASAFLADVRCHLVYWTMA